jgi:hypothetical protein
MALHLKITGFILILLALMHARLPQRFGWGRELKAVSLITRQILYVHTFFIAFVIFLMGMLCLISTEDLFTTAFGKKLSLGLFAFWFVRLFFQFFVYSPELWRGRRFETAIHILFSIMWTYISGVFFLSWWQ